MTEIYKSYDSNKLAVCNAYIIGEREREKLRWSDVIEVTGKIYTYVLIIDSDERIAIFSNCIK